jgi:hypothetical protein
MVTFLERASHLLTCAPIKPVAPAQQVLLVPSLRTDMRGYVQFFTSFLPTLNKVKDDSQHTAPNF